MLSPLLAPVGSDKGDEVTEVRNTVVLHSETVKKAETLAKEIKQARRELNPPTQKSSRVRKSRRRPDWVAPEVWDRALRLAQGDATRIVANRATPRSTGKS